jgi:putative ABC transport system substrate-binding protein
VFLTVTDPLSQGLVASLAHPGGNITGFSTFEFSTGTKCVETLKAISPSLRRVATIFNPEIAPYYPLYLRSIEKAASEFAVEPIVDEVHDDAEIERAISTQAREPGGGLIVMPDTFNVVHRQTIITLAARYSLPTIYYLRYFATDGGLISYGPDEIDLFRRTASYVDRILKGEKPGFRRSNRPNSCSSSTSRPRRHLASPCRCRCSPPPTRLSNSCGFVAVHMSLDGRLCCKSR